MNDWAYTDMDEDTVTVEASAVDGSAFLITPAGGVFVPAVKIPDMCRALYESAGLEAPELPAVVDAAMVEKLTQALEAADCGYPVERRIAAREMVADGWAK